MFQAVQTGRENPPLFSVFPCLILSPPNRKMGQVEIKKRPELGQSLQGMRGTTQLGPPLEAASLPQGAGAWVFHGKAGPSYLGAPTSTAICAEKGGRNIWAWHLLWWGVQREQRAHRCPVPSSSWLDPPPPHSDSRANATVWRLQAVFKQQESPLLSQLSASASRL